MGSIEQKLKELGLELPPCPKPVGAYVPGVLHEDLVFVSGQTPIEGDTLVYKGKVGKDLTVEEGYKAARLSVLRCLSELKATVGDLDKVEGILKLTGFVNSTGDFGDQPRVINGASELLEKIFGEKGKHARAAIGVSTLPGNAAVEVELIAKIKKN